MGFSLLPKETNLFILFGKQAQFAVDAAMLFAGLTRKGNFNTDTVQKMHDIEHQADEICHEIIEKLNKTYITPFDREDIHRLATELDSVTDMIYTISRRMMVYKINDIDADLIDFSSVIEKSVRALACAINGLSDSKRPQTTLNACIEVNRLENIGDTMRDAILAKLFETIHDPIFLIKWKEIYLFAETVLDICEDVAHVVETIIVKQA
jgi:hypothetical protein